MIHHSPQDLMVNLILSVSLITLLIHSKGPIKSNSILNLLSKREIQLFSGVKWEKQRIFLEYQNNLISEYIYFPLQFLYQWKSVLSIYTLIFLTPKSIVHLSSRTATAFLLKVQQRGSKSKLTIIQSSLFTC